MSSATDLSGAPSRWRSLTGRLGVSGMLAAATVLGGAIVALFAPVVAPYDPNTGDLRSQFAPISGAHWFGADESGRDILSRLAFGARPSLLGPLLVVLIALALGVPLAIASAWRGGWLDAVIGRFLDIVFSFPSVLTSALITMAFARGLVPAVAAVGISYVPYAARITRSAALRERSLTYVSALELQGLSTWRICVRHLLPNLAPIIIAQAAVAFGYALVDLAALSFLGLGVQPPNADWGVMVGSTAAIARGNYNQLIFAGLAIIVMVYAFSTLGRRLAGDEAVL